MTIDYTKLPFHWTGDAWILPDEERRANTLDDYWDEPSAVGYEYLLLETDDFDRWLDVRCR